ncbi:MAG: hypothetical protein MZV70_62580 [Desulfobacterales bacterium]|nr:hypothetical protein [Desulfobacterales bacterium]
MQGNENIPGAWAARVVRSSDAAAGDSHRRRAAAPARNRHRRGDRRRAPLPGLGVARDEVPASVQAIGAAELGAPPARSTCPSFSPSACSGVNANQIAGSPYQVDLNYRGFYTASPLLGTAQGLSVYLDGMRLNEPFGEVAELGPGAGERHRRGESAAWGAPGLRAQHLLGGALALRSESGRDLSSGVPRAARGEQLAACKPKRNSAPQAPIRTAPSSRRTPGARTAGRISLPPG